MNNSGNTQFCVCAEFGKFSAVGRHPDEVNHVIATVQIIGLSAGQNGLKQTISSSSWLRNATFCQDTYL